MAATSGSHAAISGSRQQRQPRILPAWHQQRHRLSAAKSVSSMAAALYVAVISINGESMGKSGVISQRYVAAA